MALVGNLRDLRLANIIQINCIERNVAKVTVQNGQTNGAVYFSNGSIVHAEFGPYVGERAVHEMLALNEGEFKVESGIESVAQTVTHPWNSVVLEGLRLIDEKKVSASPLPRQLFALLAGLRNVENVFVLNYNGQVLEGNAPQGLQPLALTFVWYKLKKMLNLFYADQFEYILLRRKRGFTFIFEHSPNLIVIETDRKVIPPDLIHTVQKVLRQINQK